MRSFSPGNSIVSPCRKKELVIATAAESAITSIA
jgi:hypothetical protein